MWLARLCLVAVLLISPCLAANILVILPFPGYSHTMPFMPIFKELGRRGHNLTLITAFVQEPNPPGFNQIPSPITQEKFKESMKKLLGGKGMTLASTKFLRGPFYQLGGFWYICSKMTPEIIKPTVSVLPPKGTKFDLVFVESFFCMEPFLAASSYYNASIVVTHPNPLSAFSDRILGNPIGSSYMPNSKTSLSGKMNFLERVWNTVVNTVELLAFYLYHLPTQDRLMRELLDAEDVPYIGDLLQNISLVLAETHFSLSYPRTYHRNVVEVGGISVQLAKPLPKDLEKFINEAKDGVILFSWGSHFNAPDAGSIMDVLMKEFSKLKQRVIVKWWHTDFPNKPDNVLVLKWVPQPSVLAHKNTVLFISHGGLNSAYEAAYHGVPVLGTPIFGDNPYNLKVLEYYGMALNVDVFDITDGVSFSAALKRLLSDPSFRENAKKRSAIMKDRPMPVVDEATYWIEYILKHGSDHLQPASRTMSWYSVALIDVWAFIIAVVAVPIILALWLLRCCLSRCFRKSTAPVSKKKKKN